MVCLRQPEESSTMIISFSLHNSCSNKMCQVILTKPSLCDCSACFRIKFVSIDTLENNTFSIQAHDSFFQFKSAESDFGFADLDFISDFVCQNHCKRVEIRYFGTPRLAIFNCPVYRFLFIGFCDDRSIFICQDRFHRTLAHNILRCREDTICTIII